MSDQLIKKVIRSKRPLTLPVDESYKEIYDQLMLSGVSAAEHLRRVVYPELERLKRLAIDSAG